MQETTQKALAVLKKKFNEEIIEVKPLLGGCSNIVKKIKTEKNEYVLRIFLELNNPFKTNEIETRNKL